MKQTPDDETRLRRMGVWIKHAEDLPESEYHLRFICLWVAFDAAFSRFNPRSNGGGKGRMLRFLWRVTNTDDDADIHKILHNRRPDIEEIIRLRQTAPAFWEKESIKILDDSQWEGKFQGSQRDEKDRLKTAIRDKRHVYAALKDLFGRLYVVRNQIFHGGSSGVRSHGMTQARLGALLLSDFVPCFRKIMRKDADWGKVPFPRVGQHPDQQGSDVPPPWMGRK